MEDGRENVIAERTLDLGSQKTYIPSPISCFVTSSKSSLNSSLITDTIVRLCEDQMRDCERILKAKKSLGAIR